jgi:hypothetical protein
MDMPSLIKTVSFDAANAHALARFCCGLGPRTSGLPGFPDPRPRRTGRIST